MDQNMDQRLDQTARIARPLESVVQPDGSVTLMLEISGGGYRPWTQMIPFQLPSLPVLRMNPLHWKRQLEAEIIRTAKERWNSWQKHAQAEWEATAGLTGLPAGMKEHSSPWTIVLKNEHEWWNEQWSRHSDNETTSAAITCAWQFAPRLRIKVRQLCTLANDTQWG